MMYENIQLFMDSYGTDFSRNAIVLPDKNARKMHCSIPHKECHNYALKYFDGTINKYGSDLIRIKPKIYC